MSHGVHRWTVRLTAAAEADFEHVIRWTSEKFGDTQALIYAETITTALTALAEGPAISGTKSRGEILKGLCSLHVARQGRKGRHFIMFRLAPRASGNVIEVLRILHDSMDLTRHFEPGGE